VNLLEELLGKGPSVAQSQMMQSQNSWIQDLIKSKYQPQQGRIKRAPVGFNFTREPFDPSSYYKSLDLIKNSSNLATVTAQQEAFNRESAAQAADEARRRNSITQALKGINPNFTYSPGPNVIGGPTAGGGMAYPVQKGLRNYGLKGVSGNVSNAANYWGSRYGVQDVGGWRAHGSVPGSDHPYGRALDFMTYKDSKKGTALANDLIKNYKQWNIKYVIWNRYIWNPRVGWHKYNGPSPHTDHVHASFNK
jgi:hypothetical protein